MSTIKIEDLKPTEPTEPPPPTTKPEEKSPIRTNVKVGRKGRGTAGVRG